MPMLELELDRRIRLYFPACPSLLSYWKMCVARYYPKLYGVWLSFLVWRWIISARLRTRVVDGAICDSEHAERPILIELDLIRT